MARRLVFVWLVVAAVLAIGSLVTASCKSFPDEKECRGDKVNVLVEAGPEVANACTSCLQQSCCDLTGACADEPETACPKEFKGAQECVIEGGAAAESVCRGQHLTTESSRQLYTCMRKECGPKCGVSNCALNSAVTLFGAPQCDRCIGGSCCEPIPHKCYENRQCKLFLECITGRCPNTLGPTLAVAGNAPSGALEAARDQVCAGGAPPEDLRAPCLQRCLLEFAPFGPLTTPDDQSARCLAFGVYTCGARAKCGEHCVIDGGQVATGPYPEDLDAATR